MMSGHKKPTYAELVNTIKQLKAHIVEHDKRIVQQDTRIAEQDKVIGELRQKLAAANKNSRNSSKPPSSDITRPPAKHRKPGRPKKRRIGGQEGHPRHESDLSLEDADHVEEFHADQILDDPSLDLVPAPEYGPKIIYQYEFVDTPVALTAYVSHAYRDRSTGKVVYAPFPDGIETAGILGPRLTAFAACLKGGLHTSYTGTNRVLGYLGVDVCRATVCKKIKNVSNALGFSYNQLLTALPEQTHMNIDETGHKDNPFEKPADHKKHWIWVFAAPFFTVFRIFGTRSTDVLREVLGEDCAAMIGADFYNVYTCFMEEAHVKIQLCWAHLIRDIKFLSESPDKITANYGDRLLKLCRLIFHLHHRRKELGEETFQRRMTKLKKTFLATGRRSRATGARGMVARLKTHGELYFLFLEHPEIEPTNNLAERELRHCVMGRRITQGTRGNDGQRWCERIWTIMATCARQNRDAFAFVTESVRTFYAKQPQPSLLPSE